MAELLLGVDLCNVSSAWFVVTGGSYPWQHWILTDYAGVDLGNGEPDWIVDLRHSLPNWITIVGVDLGNGEPDWIVNREKAKWDEIFQRLQPIKVRYSQIFIVPEITI